MVIMNGCKEGGGAATSKREGVDDAGTSTERSIISPGRSKEYEILRREGPNINDTWQGDSALA